ncbi:MAG: hypothetical protein H7A43_08855 [Verrucomicrobia bacterium]|nr:hypothetical protein [Verrucomicrobiota bacterium]
MEAQPDYRELLELFNSRGVEFLIVGAYALAFYGSPRTTGDIDLLVNPTPDNAERIIAALDDFGFGSLGLRKDDFLAPDQVIQLGVPPVRIDILTSLSGITWTEAYDGKEAGSYGDVPVFFIGKSEYIKNKKATGRKKDEADIEALEDNQGRT